VKVALIPPCVPVSASCTRIVFAYSEDTRRGTVVGKIAGGGVVNGDHISRLAVNIQLTTYIRFERGADRCMSAGFQVDEVISTIGKFDNFTIGWDALLEQKIRS
jgi:hypothetical protein